MIGTVLTTGGADGAFGVIAAGLLLQAGTVPLALLVAYRLFAGYRGSGDRAMLSLATGLVFLFAIPTIVRFVFPTVIGGEALLQELVAGSSEIFGLVAILYAIYGRGGRRRTVRKRYEADPSAAVFPLSVVAVIVWQAGGVLGIAPAITAATVAQITSVVTAVLGGYVAAIAFRGYRRNDSRPMAFLSLGVVLVTVVRVGTELALLWVFGATGPTILLATACWYLLGLAAIYHSLTRA